MPKLKHTKAILSVSESEKTEPSVKRKSSITILENEEIAEAIIASWSHIPLSYLQPVGGLFLLQCNFDLKRLPKVDIPIDFYKEALCARQKIDRSTPNIKKQVLNEIV